MSRFERDQNQPSDPPDDATRDAQAPAEPISDADESVAHIAELVRRTTERQGKPSPSPATHPDATMAHPPPVAVAHPDATMAHPPPMTATQVASPIARPAAPTGARHNARQDAKEPGRTMWQPSRRILATAGVLVLLLVGGGVALAHPFGSSATPSTASAPKTTAPDGYAVKVTDVITDCAGHSRGRTKASFQAENCLKATRLLATGVVGGRPVLFVVSRIEMATSEAAASVKQVLDGNGTGNINDLLREGKTYAGAPYQMPISGYASLQQGKTVTVAEAGFVDDGRSSSTDPALRSAAAEIAGRAPTQG